MNDTSDTREVNAAAARQAAQHDLDLRTAANDAGDPSATVVMSNEAAAVQRDMTGDVNLTTEDIDEDASATGATLGAVGGALAGAAAGSILGPPGAVAGAAAGALIGAGASGLAVGAIEEAELSSDNERLENERVDNDTPPIV